MMTPKEFMFWLRGYIAAGTEKPIGVVFDEISKQMDGVNLTEKQIERVEKLVDKIKPSPMQPYVPPINPNSNIALMYGCQSTMWKEYNFGTGVTTMKDNLENDNK